MQYRRAKTPGATYFFTVVTFRRREILCEPENRELLRTAFHLVKTQPGRSGTCCSCPTFHYGNDWLIWSSLSPLLDAECRATIKLLPDLV